MVKEFDKGWNAGWNAGWRSGQLSGINAGRDIVEQETANQIADWLESDPLWEGRYCEDMSAQIRRGAWRE